MLSANTESLFCAKAFRKGAVLRTIEILIHKS